MKKLLSKTSLSLALLSSASLALAAYQEVDMDRMLTGSELVVQATVVGQRVEQQAGQKIRTIITLNISDTIKGDWNTATIDIGFAGGSLNGITRHVSGQHLPEFGEEGVFFIENPYRNQVNPLYGWEQGLFIVEPDPSSGEKQVKTAQKEPISSIDFVTNNITNEIEISDGIASGIQLQSISELNAPYTLMQFKNALRTHLSPGEK